MPVGGTSLDVDIYDSETTFQVLHENFGSPINDQEEVQKFLEEHDLEVYRCRVVNHVEDRPPDLSFLEKYPGIKYLTLYKLVDYDVSLLTILTDLQELSIRDCRGSLKGIGVLPSLWLLVFEGFELVDLSYLTHLKLEALHILGNPINNIQAINTERLSELTLTYSPSAVRVLREMIPAILKIAYLAFYVTSPDLENRHLLTDFCSRSVANAVVEKWFGPDMPPQYATVTYNLLLHGEQPSGEKKDGHLLFGHVEELGELVDILSESQNLRISVKYNEPLAACTFEIQSFLECCEDLIDHITRERDCALDG